jgi:hypothetical protein
MVLRMPQSAADLDVPSESAAAPSPPLALVKCDANHFVGTWRDVFVTIWRREVTVASVLFIQHRVRAFARRCSTRRCATLTIVEEGAPMPSSEARTALSNMFRFNAEEILCSSVAMEGNGFRAAAVRAVADGLSLVARQPFPHKTFATIDQATLWLGSQMVKARVLANVVGLREAIADVRPRGATSWPPQPVAERFSRVAPPDAREPR